MEEHFNLLLDMFDLDQTTPLSVDNVKKMIRYGIDWRNLLENVALRLIKASSKLELERIVKRLFLIGLKLIEVVIS